MDWNDHAALALACLKCDDTFLKEYDPMQSPPPPLTPPLSPEFLGMEDGSTAAFCLVTHDAPTNEYKTINGNIGDSRSVLARRRADGTYETIALTEDHKPTDELVRALVPPFLTPLGAQPHHGCGWHGPAWPC